MRKESASFHSHRWYAAQITAFKKDDRFDGTEKAYSLAGQKAKDDGEDGCGPPVQLAYIVQKCGSAYGFDCA